MDGSTKLSDITIDQALFMWGSIAFCMIALSVCVWLIYLTICSIRKWKGWAISAYQWSVRHGLLPKVGPNQHTED
jgi:hypothetical protein